MSKRQKIEILGEVFKTKKSLEERIRQEIKDAGHATLQVTTAKANLSKH